MNWDFSFSFRQWALNQSILSEITTNFEDFNDRKPSASQHYHKEELPGRIKADSADRAKIKTNLESCINPLSTEEHPQDGIVNIENGRVYSSATTNVDNAVATGSKQLQDFINKLPNSFNEPIKVVTSLMMDNQFKSAVIVKVVSIEKILGQLLLLQQNGEDMKVILRCYELFPLPLSMFQKNGKPRQTQKSVLKKLLASLVSLRLIEAPDVKMIDGCAQLWYVEWPSSGTIEGFLILFFQKLERYLNTCDIVLIFDRYFFIVRKMLQEMSDNDLQNCTV